MQRSFVSNVATKKRGQSAALHPRPRRAVFTESRPLIESLELRQLLSAAVIGTGAGLQGEYFDNQDFTNLKVTRIDPKVQFNWGSGAPDGIQRNMFSVRWTGQVQAEKTDTYTFYTYSDDGVRLWVDGKLIIDNWTTHAATLNSGTLALVAGQKYDIRLDYFQAHGKAVAKLAWSSPTMRKQIIPQTQLYAPAAAPTDAPTTDTPTTDTPTSGTPPTDVPSSNPPVTNIPAPSDPSANPPVTTIPSTPDPVSSNPAPTPIPTPTPMPTTTPPSDSSTTAPQLPGNWSLIFGDEFSGSSLSPAWSNSMWGKTYGGASKVFNGTLQLSAPDANTSMLINTENGSQPFSFTYGYAEAKMQIPKGQGIWPAFWMLPLESFSPDASAGEIDVYEGQGNQPAVDSATYHWGNPDHQIGTDLNAGVDLSQDFHTYGVDWEKDHITWYLDGKAVQTVTSQQAVICAGPMYLILDVWLGGWNGKPDSTTPFPATMNIDWVHVWQNGASGSQAAAVQSQQVQSQQAGGIAPPDNTAGRSGSVIAALETAA